MPSYSTKPITFHGDSFRFVYFFHPTFLRNTISFTCFYALYFSILHFIFRLYSVISLFLLSFFASSCLYIFFTFNPFPLFPNFHLSFNSVDVSVVFCIKRADTSEHGERHYARTWFITRRVCTSGVRVCTPGIQNILVIKNGTRIWWEFLISFKLVVVKYNTSNCSKREEFSKFPIINQLIVTMWPRNTHTSLELQQCFNMHNPFLECTAV